MTDGPLFPQRWLDVAVDSDVPLGAMRLTSFIDQQLVEAASHMVLEDLEITGPTPSMDFDRNSYTIRVDARLVPGYIPTPAERARWDAEAAAVRARARRTRARAVARIAATTRRTGLTRSQRERLSHDCPTDDD